MNVLQQAADFRDEREAVSSLLDDSGDDAWGTPTQCEAWTVNDVIARPGRLTCPGQPMQASGGGGRP